MKKLILAALLIVGGKTADSQVIVNDININDANVQYVELVGQAKLFNPFKLKIYVDYGQDAPLFKEQTIKGANGKNAKFNSMIDALNFMYENGWEFVSNYLIETDGGLTYKYILQRQSA